MQYNEAVKIEVDKVYKDLGKLARDLAKEHTKEIDVIVESLKDIEKLSDKEVRNAMVQLNVCSFYLGKIKEHANLRADVANALFKEKQANEFNSLVGTQQAKNSQALVNAIDNQAVQILYTNVAKLLTTTLDETHRLVATLKDVLIGRMYENKLMKPKETEQREYEEVF